jgi:spermidine synthase
MPHAPTLSLNTNPASRQLWRWVAILYCLSGLTSLAYEVLWARMLSLQFGVSIFGVVLTIAAFMIGLGLGSLAGVRWVRMISKPLAWFALLEMAIAFYSLLLPSLVQAMGGWMSDVATRMTLVQWYLLQGGEALCLLVLPAFAMGLSFALVLKVVERTPLSLGKLYGLNTVGGAAGALFPLWSLSALGWTNSVRTVALIGLSIGVAGLTLSYLNRASQSGNVPSKIQQTRPPLSALFVYAGIGAGSIMLEVCWIRLYGMVLLRTEYVLGVILAVFLLGIAFGSMLLPRVHKQWLTILLPLATGAGVLASLWLLPAVSAWVEQSQFRSFIGATWTQALILGLFTLPVTLSLGAWLPLLAGRLAGTEASGVWLYGANCLGGAIGAIIACLLLIPSLGSVGTVAIAGLAIASLGMFWVNSRRVWLAIPIMMMVAWHLRNMPPVHVLLPQIEANSRDLYLYEDAIAMTHVIQQQDGQRVLLSDLQRMDASSDPSAVEIQMDQARLALLLHPAPHSVLFLGLGTGISMAGSAPFPDLQRSAVELSRGAIVAARTWFAPVNRNIMDQAQTKRDDARHFLITSKNKYDVIIGDLFHPDLAGMGALLSVQQFQRARNHLNADGVFVQWLALNQFDIQSLKVVLRSFRQVFPDAQLFMDGMHLAMIGPHRRFLGAGALFTNLHRMTAQEQSHATGGEGAWTWLGRYWGPIPDTAGPVQDEWVPYIEFSLPRARYNGSVNLPALLGWMLEHRPDVDTAGNILAVGKNNREKFGRAYFATELTMRAWIASIQGEPAKAGKLIWLAYQANPQDRWIADALADNMLESLPEATQQGLSEREALQRILKISPNFAGALRAFWHLEKTAGNSREAELFHSRLLAVSPLDAEARTIR